VVIWYQAKKALREGCFNLWWVFMDNVKEMRKLFKKWKRTYRKRLEFALYQYSLGIVTGTVAEELRLLKMLDKMVKLKAMFERDLEKKN